LFSSHHIFSFELLKRVVSFTMPAPSLADCLLNVIRVSSQRSISINIIHTCKNPFTFFILVTFYYVLMFFFNFSKVFKNKNINSL